MGPPSDSGDDVNGGGGSDVNNGMRMLPLQWLRSLRLHPHLLRGQLGTVVAVLLCVAIVVLPVTWVLTSSTPTPKAHHPAKVHDAEQRVLHALGVTTGSGNFSVTYQLTESSPSSSAPPTTGLCGPGQGCSAGPQNVSVSGQGTIDVDPTAMAVSADVSDFGNLAVRVDATQVWELSAGDNGLAPNPGDGAGGGQPLSAFANLVESTLGRSEGAMAMLGMASPNGFLDLSQAAVTSASQTGSGVMGGVAVTEYQVSIDLSCLAQSTGISAEEAQTVTSAVGVLDDQGYTGTTETVAVDAAGYIREVKPVASFSDGSSVTLDATFSDFGCAGAVLMPGQQGSTAPPASCTSPDTVETGSSAPTTSVAAASTPPAAPTMSTPTTTAPASSTTTGAPTVTISGPTTTGE